jgi:pSer/pThr/pTyr-binding forkhead associated (FHA) protein
MISKKLTLAQFNKADLLKGRHILIVESPESRRAVVLNSAVFSIGRHPNNSLVLADRMVSRHHATIAWLRYTKSSGNFDYAYWVIDGKGKTKRSRNGVFVNEEQKLLHRLTPGDTISLGQDIQITYSYIPYNTETHDLLNYYDNKKDDYLSQSSKNKDESFTDTVVINDISQI